jgi:hypothetical protein
MTVQKTSTGASVVEVLDRVLDRGVVIDAWVRVSVAGIALLDIDARVVVASIDTYTDYPTTSHQEIPAARTRPPRARVGRRTLRRPARRSRPAVPVTLRCDAGCTFVRSSRRPPATARCPAARQRLCPVTTVTAA